MHSMLPGYKAPYIDCKSFVLRHGYIVVFRGLVSFQTEIVAHGLACSNQITHCLGMGLTPRHTS